MAEFNKVSDILEVAVRIERIGLDFYKTLSGIATNSQAKDAFSFLAAEEEKHIGVFRKLLEKSADYTVRLQYPGEYELYLEGVASRNVFIQQKMQDKKIIAAVDVSEAIEVGMDFETQSILFYSEFLNSFKGDDQKCLNEVIKEEKGHFAKLVNLKDKIKF